MSIVGPLESRRGSRSLVVVALAAIAACSGSRPLSPTTVAAGTSAAGDGGGGGTSAGAGASGVAGSGAAGSGGTAGSGGIAGSSGIGGSSGVAGSGAAGSGFAGSGFAGSGVAGSGVAGSGAAGSGVGGTVAGGGGTGALTIDTIDDFEPVAINAAGDVVAGHGRGFAARWTAMTGVVLLPITAADVTSSTVAAMDRGGAVFVGSVQNAKTSQAVVWLGDTARPLGFARAGDDASRAVACSGDGMTVAGNSENRAGVANLRQQAFVWRAASGMKLVPFMAGDAGSEALAISLDGSSVIGFSYDGTRRRAFWWHEGSDTVEIPPPPGAASVVPRGLSADGAVVVGDATFAAGLRAFRWTRAGGVELAATRDDRDQSRAVGVSDDGATITGLAFTDGQWKDLPIPFRWKPPSPTLLTTPPDDLPVPDVFTDAAGTTIVGLGQIYVTSTAFLWRPGTQFYDSLKLGPMPASAVGVALSAKGSVLLGKGTGSGGKIVAWLMHLP